MYCEEIVKVLKRDQLVRHSLNLHPIRDVQEDYQEHLVGLSLESRLTGQCGKLEVQRDACVKAPTAN